MLENPCKAKSFNYDSHDCKSCVNCTLQEGWLACPKDFKESLAGLFQHIYLPYHKQFLQRLGFLIPTFNLEVQHKKKRLQVVF